MDQSPLGVDSIFLAALDIASPAERATYLDQACGTDAALRRRVERLLAAHPKAAGSFLESPPDELQHTIEMPPIKEGPGTVIGHYKLLQQIGEGGFGVVYMAEQQEPVRRKVALKLIKPGMDTREVIARFEAERQALALMDHPHIARVLDAGATDSGRPYFVMELVRGIPITDYCDQNSLGFRERLELFTSVCQAVQHAHQKGIIHRDVKPTNVLVTLHDGKPVVKVIDFGVAKAIDRRLTERTLFTRFAEMIGTPLYMSPEQAEMSGLDVDTRTDIYSLGVLLYELLTGSTPFDKERLGKAAYDEIRRIIREEEPPRPSTRVSTLGARVTAVSEHRKTEPRKLSALLKGDLDWIVMKALEKDRTRRYETAKDFADDVQHYLNDQPVEAHAPSRLYRFRKLVRRYRVAAATLGLVLVTLSAATFFSALMAVRAWQAREIAFKSTEDAIHQKEEADRQRDRAEYEANISRQERERADQAAVQARKSADDAQQALLLLSSVIGGDAQFNSVRPEKTIIESLDALAKRLDEVNNANPSIEAHLRPIIGRAYWDAQRGDEAKNQFRRAIDAQRWLFGETDRRTLDTMNWLAVACNETGEPAEGERLMRIAMKAWEAIGGRQGQAGRARAGSQLCVSLLQQGRPREALAVGEAALELERPLHWDGDVAMGWSMANLSRAHGMLGNAEEQLALLRDALDVFERAGDLEGQWQMWDRLGDASSQQKMMADARKAYEQTVRLSERQGAQRIVRLHKSTEKLSDILLHMRDYEAAAKISREFLDLAEPLLGQSDPCVAEQRASLACALAVQGKSDEADALLRASIARMDENSQWSLYMRLGNVLHTAGDWLRAKDFREHALRVSANLDIQKRHEATFSLGFTLCDLRDYQAAEHLYREFLQFAKDKLENNDRRICAERYFLAWVLHVQGRKQEAAAAYGEVSAALRNTINSGRTMWWRILDRLIYTEAVAMSTSDEASLQESVQILEEIEDEVVSDRNQNGWWYANRAVIEEKLGRKEEAIRHARLFVEHADPNSPDAHRTSREMLVRLLTEAGQHDEAEQVLRQGVEDCEQRLGDANIITNYTRADLAEYLMKHEKFAAADEPLRRAQSLVTDMRVPASQRQRIVTLLVNYCQATGNQEEAAQWRATEAITGNGAIKAEEG